MLRRLSLSSLGLLFGLGLALVACEGGEGASCSNKEMDRADTILALTGDETAGATTFANTCGGGGCHGSDGDSGPAPNLSNEIGELDDTGLTCLMLGGVGDMPSQGSLSDQQLADVQAYVLANF